MVQNFHLNPTPSLAPFVTSPSTPPPFPFLWKIMDPQLLVSQSYHVKFSIIGFVFKRISKWLFIYLFLFGNDFTPLYITFINWSFAPEVSKAQKESTSRDWCVILGIKRCSGSNSKVCNRVKKRTGKAGWIEKRKVFVYKGKE